MITITSVLAIVTPFLTEYIATKGLDGFISRLGNKDNLAKSIVSVYFSLIEINNGNQNPYHFSISKAVQDSLISHFLDVDHDLSVLKEQLRNDDKIKDFTDGEYYIFFEQLLKSYGKVPELVPFLNYRYSYFSNKSINRLLEIAETKFGNVSDKNEIYTYFKDQLALFANYIHNLKLKTALDLLSNLETYILNRIGNIDYSILVQIEYLKGKCNLYLNEKDAFTNFERAYTLLEQNDDYDFQISKSYMLVIYEKDKEKANNIAKNILLRYSNDPEAHFIKCILSSDIDIALEKVPQNVIEDYKFKKLFIDCYNRNLDKAPIIIKYIKFEISESPQDLAYDNLNLWIYNLNILFNDFLKKNGFSYKCIDSNNNEALHKFAEDFWTRLQTTEISYFLRYTFFIVCYTGHLKDENQKWVTQFFSLEPLNIEWYNLFKTNLLFKDKKEEEGIALLKTLDVNELTANVKIFLGLLNANNTLILEGIHDVIAVCPSIDEFICPRLFPALSIYEIANKVKEGLLDKAFDNPNDKIITEQYINDSLNQEVDIDKLLSIKETDLSPLMLSKFSLLLAKNGKAEIGANMISNIVDQQRPSPILLDYLDILKIGGIRKRESLNILHNLRKSGYKLPLEFLNIEYSLSMQIQNTENAFEVIKEMYDITPQNEGIYVQYLLCAFQNNAVEIIKNHISSIFSFIFKNDYSISTIGNILLLAKMYDIALEFVYKYASDSNAITTRFFYSNISLVKEIAQIQSQSINKVEDGAYVAYKLNGKDVDGVVWKNSKWDLLLDRCVGDIFDFEEYNKKYVVEILDIRNKYFALAKEIYKEFSREFSPYPVVTFKPQDNNFDSVIEEIKQRIGPNEEEQTKNWEALITKYKNGKASLYYFKRDNIIKSYYNLIFSDFAIYINPLPVYMPLLDSITDDIYDKVKYVLDFSSLWFLSSLADTSIEYPNKFIISRKIRDMLLESIRKEELQPSSDTYMKVTTKYIHIDHIPEFVHVKYIENLKRLLNWIDEYCEVVLVEEKLDFIPTDDNSEEDLDLLIDIYLLSSRDYHILISDDYTFNRQIRNIRQISTEAYAHYVLDDKNIITKNQLILGYVGGALTKDLILAEYHRLRNDEYNHFNTCLETIERNKTLWSIVIDSIIEIINTSLDLQVDRFIIIQMFTSLVKGLDQKTINYLKIMLSLGFPSIDNITRDIILNSFDGAVEINSSSKLIQ